MSVHATIFVLFRVPPPAARVVELDGLIEHCAGARRAERTDDFERLVVVDEADEYVDVASNGMLIYYAGARAAARSNGDFIEGRLFKIDYLTRYWEVFRGGMDFFDGPAIRYALTLMVLLAQSDIEGVWYGADEYHQGAHIKRMTNEIAHRMIDEYIARKCTQRGGVGGEI